MNNGVAVSEVEQVFINKDGVGKAPEGTQIGENAHNTAGPGCNRRRRGITTRISGQEENGWRRRWRRNSLSRLDRGRNGHRFKANECHANGRKTK